MTTLATSSELFTWDPDSERFIEKGGKEMQIVVGGLDEVVSGRFEYYKRVAHSPIIISPSQLHEKISHNRHPDAEARGFCLHPAFEVRHPFPVPGPPLRPTVRHARKHARKDATIHALTHALASILAHLRGELAQASPPTSATIKLNSIWVNYSKFEGALVALAVFCGRVRPLLIALPLFTKGGT
jgi:hypothetical protein